MLRNLSKAALLLLVAAPVLAEEPVDWDMVNRIRDEGIRRSQVMDTVKHLTDEIGPRLTGSPAMKEANEWTRDQMAEWGLQDAHLEAYGPFGRGWTFRRTSVHMITPRQVPLEALPSAWTPGTDGPVRGYAVKLKIESKEDMERWRGKLAGKILFVDDARDLMEAEEPAFQRRTDEDLAKMTIFEIPGERGRFGRRARGDWRARARQRYEIRDELHQYLVDEGVVAIVKISSRDGGLVRVSGGGSRESDKNPGVPEIVMAAEQYNWILRMLPDPPKPKGKGRRGGERAEPAEGEAHPEAQAEEGEAHAEGEAEEAKEEEAEEAWELPVELEIDVAAQFYDDDEMAYNTIAEIPGTDPKAGFVMLGAHLDSWHGGTGATDNAAGCAVMMEAVRILEAIGAKPRRTIRVGLWSGEEQGLLGSRAYVEEHLAKLPIVEDEKTKGLPRWLQKMEGEVTTLPDHARLAAYFNLDNGSGRIRGVYAQENAAAAAIFKDWLVPFHDLEATTVSMNDTGGTDHLSFDAVGLPGFQFIQDGLDYFSRTHHTNMDVYDHLVREDLIQASVIVASFAYHAAMRDEPLPRKPMPRYEPRKEEED